MSLGIIHISEVKPVKYKLTKCIVQAFLKITTKLKQFKQTSKLINGDREFGHRNVVYSKRFVLSQRLRDLSPHSTLVITNCYQIVLSDRLKCIKFERTSTKE